jgi:MoaA/NifB/PqqE/SkfB family radical SAM enzyme
MDRYGIDDHKLHLHVARVADWLAGKLTYPIYMELSPAGGCNHRCTFCGLDFMGYQGRFLDREVLGARLTELAQLGLRSVMYSGEGEPLLHRDLAAIVHRGKGCGIDQAITTNGVLLRPELAERLLPCCEWIKVSCNAGTRDTYAALHGTRAEDFDRVRANLAEAARQKTRRGDRCVLGVQLLLLPENRGEVVALARWAREAGLDYLVVKPYSQHPRSITTRYAGVRYDEDLALADELAALSTSSFAAIFRRRAMARWDAGDRPYSRCLALPFWSYVDSGANVWGCSMFLGDERFLYGNLREQTFQEIWEGERRRSSLAWVEGELDAGTCRVNCRMDAINRYLRDLRHPPPHASFI